MVKVAAYIRVSTEDQTQYSPDSQLRLIRAYVQRHGWYLADDLIFSDEGISGRQATNRPAFMKMIQKAKERPRPFEKILVYSLSRFARSRQDSIVYKQMLRKQLGIEVISVTQDFGEDKAGILMEAIIEAMDEYYSIDLGENVKRGMLEKVTRGEPVTIAPFGYRMEHKQLIPDPETSPVVKYLFEKFTAGASLQELANTLNCGGIFTNRGNNWEPRTIRYLLCNPVYIGKIRWSPSKGEPACITDGQHTPLISVKVWDYTQKRLKQNRATYSASFSNGSIGSHFPLKKLIFCGSCGRILSRSSQQSLQCCGYAKGICKHSHSITIKKMTQWIESMLSLLFPNMHCCPQTDDGWHKQEQEILLRCIEKEQKKLDRARNAYLSGIDSLVEYQQEKQRCQAQIRRLDQQIGSLPSHVPVPRKITVFLDHFLSSPSLSDQEKNLLLHTIFSRIIYDTNPPRLRVYIRIP